jgi:hypothetical protein
MIALHLSVAATIAQIWAKGQKYGKNHFAGMLIVNFRIIDYFRKGPGKACK